VLVFEDQKLVDILDRGGKLTETERCEFYNGVLVPGLINAHCHLELSHLFGKIPQNMGMKEFLQNVMMRKADYETQILYAKRSDRFMQLAGIVAVGDISNTNITLDIKRASPIIYHTFVEVLGLDERYTPERYKAAVSLYEEFQSHGLAASVTPHAAYSVHRDLLERIASFQQDGVLSIHTLENPIECEKLTKQENSFLRFFHELAIESNFENHDHPYHYLLTPFFNRKVLLVHNLTSGMVDWQVAQNIAQIRNLELFLVTCPRSNMFIHGKIPDYSTWPKDLPICIGTDSLASNFDLSVFRELLFLTQHSPFLFTDVLPWATINGAKALGLEDRLGSFDLGKTPGVNLITGFDFSRQALLPHATLQRVH